jgi:hypothetical protein
MPDWRLTGHGGDAGPLLGRMYEFDFLLRRFPDLDQLHSLEVARI